MNQTEIRTGICPKCGENLEIPSRLTDFSCLYCGTRLTPKDLLPASYQADIPDGADSAKYYTVHVLQTISGHQGIARDVTRSRFDEDSGSIPPPTRKSSAAWIGLPHPAL